MLVTMLFESGMSNVRPQLRLVQPDQHQAAQADAVERDTRLGQRGQIGNAHALYLQAGGLATAALFPAL